MMTNEISLAPLREDIQIVLPDGRAFNGPKGTTAEAFMKFAKPEMRGRLMAVLINGQLRELQ